MSAEAGQGTNGGTRDGQHVALVHDRLRAAILLGELPAGQTTSQVTLARDLEVGRTPLREALRMLQREGLVVSEPNRRVRIAALSSTDAEELYVMRIALEAVAIRITVPTLTSTDFAELEGLMAQMDHYMRSEDRGDARPAPRVPRPVRPAAGERVTTTIGQLFDHGERYRLRYGATTAERWDQRRAEHRAIVDAAAAGDADLAARHLVAHYAQTASFIFAALDPGHDLARLRTTMADGRPGQRDEPADPGLSLGRRPEPEPRRQARDEHRGVRGVDRRRACAPRPSRSGAGSPRWAGRRRASRSRTRSARRPPGRSSAARRARGCRQAGVVPEPPR